MKKLKDKKDKGVFTEGSQPIVIDNIQLYSLSAEILSEDSDNFECVRRINEQIKNISYYYNE